MNYGMIFIETLVYVVKEGKVLLIRKKRGLGAGYYNGIGGKVEDGENVVSAAIRECREEVGITPRNLEWMGLLEFWNYEDDRVESVHFVHVFLARDFDGTPRESSEAEPIWFGIDEIPYNNMWEDDIMWLPKVLSDKRVYGRFEFDRWRLIKSEVYEVIPSK
ncbi:short-chain dehydrogenase/reductase SDR [Vulcanisaeta moutnovskia 768-28]|jgi:8-oxo-dGTP diphosphatase|uniref:Oxidized purine nucleoside triphosphate hydrolase n=2 Tax=Thermoproteaceae TaxID=2267 RepID=F0QXX3_VULM7|nr:short-chain dehydrogenase/reductase SDR [Vulcanisaeta moutnovskia 768-28]